MNTSRLSQLAATDYLPLISAVVLAIGGLAVLLLRDALQRRRQLERNTLNRFVEQGIDPCLEWAAMVCAAPGSSGGVNPYSDCKADSQVTVAAAKLRSKLGDAIADRLDEAIRVVNGIGADPGFPPDPTPAQRDVLDESIPALVEELEWWREAFAANPLLGGITLKWLRYRARRKFRRPPTERPSID